MEFCAQQKWMNQPNNQKNMSWSEGECDQKLICLVGFGELPFSITKRLLDFSSRCSTQDVWNSSWHVNRASILGFKKDISRLKKIVSISHRIHVMGLVYLPLVGKYTIVPWMRHGYCQACEHCNGCDKSHSKGPMAIFRGAFHRPECWYQIGWFKRHFWVLKAAKRHWKVLVCSLRCLYSIKVRMFLYQHVLLLI